MKGKTKFPLLRCSSSLLISSSSLSVFPPHLLLLQSLPRYLIRTPSMGCCSSPPSLLLLFCLVVFAALHLGRHHAHQPRYLLLLLDGLHMVRPGAIAVTDPGEGSLFPSVNPSVTPSVNPSVSPSVNRNVDGGGVCPSPQGKTWRRRRLKTPPGPQPIVAPGLHFRHLCETGSCSTPLCLHAHRSCHDPSATR